jgi:hypothetical protein
MTMSATAGPYRLGFAALALLIILPGCNRPADDNAASAPVAPAASASQALPPFLVKIDTTVSGGAFPVVNGTTNLPDGTPLMLMIVACSTNRGWAECPPGVTSPAVAHPGMLQPEYGAPGDWEKVAVKGGQFVSQPWSRQDREGLFDGTYVVLGMLDYAADWPPNVRAVLGSPSPGTALAGPFVEIEKTEHIHTLAYHRLFDVGSNLDGA